MKLVLLTLKYSGPTSKKTQHITITKIKQLMSFRGINALYTENYMKPTNTLFWSKRKIIDS